MLREQMVISIHTCGWFGSGVVEHDAAIGDLKACKDGERGREIDRRRSSTHTNRAVQHTAEEVDRKCEH